ncbi:hypothetical protein RMSM_04077 [Rhodopirellula maiorica SM1]|uniref:Uncharacterized protein n=1 Tax=Rhodopirellula maiorica SM1 TaxID=1265738 RepID=M5RI60_9BACT|nr:hypothetical protein [Rhodopirellula maiorica]EMI18998.1 hypothetical protein RMSM_04077 [Rhodopirellula maiorica SM1]
MARNARQPRTAAHTADCDTKPTHNRGKIAALLIIFAGAILAVMLARQYQLFQLHTMVQSARAAQDWDQVAAATNVWLDRDPDSPMALMYAAEAAQHRGSFEQAINLLSQIPVTDPAAAHAKVQQAQLFLGPLNRPMIGETKLKEATTINSRSIEAQRELLRHYGITAQRAKALAQARLAIENESDSPATYVYLISLDSIVYSTGKESNARWLESGENKELFEVAMLVNEARTIGLGESADALVDTNQRQAELTQLESQLLAALERYPENPELLAILLSTYSDRGDVQKVVSLLSQVPASAANDARFFRYKGWLHRMRDEFAEAEQSFRQAIAKDPYDWKSQTQLAETLRLQNRTSEAETALEIASMGTQLRKSILGLSTIEILPVNVLKQLHQYSVTMNDQSVADQLAIRIEQISNAATTTTP